MNRFLCRMLVLALAASALLLPSSAMAEQCGWGRTQWGMTATEVARSTGMGIIATPKDKLTREGQYFSKTKIFGLFFDAYFKFDENDKLVSILFISRLTGSMGNTIAFQRLRENLAEKYGRPALWSDSPDRAIKQYKWVTTCQVIDLSFIEPTNSDSDTLSLSYRPNTAILDEQF